MMSTHRAVSVQIMQLDQNAKQVMHIFCDINSLLTENVLFLVLSCPSGYERVAEFGAVLETSECSIGDDCDSLQQVNNIDACAALCGAESTCKGFIYEDASSEDKPGLCTLHAAVEPIFITAKLQIFCGQEIGNHFY